MALLATAVCISVLAGGGCADGTSDIASATEISSPGHEALARRANTAAHADLSAAGTPNLLKVRSASGRPLSAYPLQFGRPFVVGEIAECPGVLVDGAPPQAAQVDVKTRHPDGSVRFAVVSTVLPQVPAAGELTISFGNVPCAEQLTLSQAEMLSPRFDFDAQIALNGGAAGSASARDMLSRGHYTLWTQGPVVTTAIIADHTGKTHDMGVDAHKSLRPVFEVQFWPGIDKTRVRVILEATDTEKVQNQAYDVSVRTGSSAPTVVLSAAEVKHNFMSRWSRVFWIGGTPEGLDIDYGLAYLTRTRALPNYDASIELSPSAKQAALDAWAAAPKGLYDKGLWSKDMTVAGGRSDIGPYPKWMVSWLYDGSAALKDVALGQADLAASWPMHLREGDATKHADRARTLPAMGKPVSGYARPTLTYASLGYSYTRASDRVTVVGDRSKNGWVPDNAHQPQPFFIPYLLTGEHFYQEQMQFWAGFSLLDNAWGLYGNYCYSKSVRPEYLGLAGQVRGTAWGLRMVAEAAWSAPESAAAARTWLHDAVEDAITRWEGERGIVRGNNTARPDWQWARGQGDCTAGALAGSNPLRYWDRATKDYGSNASVARYQAVWQYAFVMYSLNRAAELGHPAESLRQWAAPFFIDAALHPNGTGYHLADYKIPVIDAQTETFFQDWDTVKAEYADYDGQRSWAPASRPNANSVNSLAQGYATVALAALASTDGVSNSLAAWQAFAAPHFPHWGWSADPKWALLPRSLGAQAAPPSRPSLFTATGTASPTRKTWESSASSPHAPQPAEAPGASNPVAPTPAIPPPAVPNPPAHGELPTWLATASVFEWRAVPASRLGSTQAWTGYKGAKGNSGKPGILAYSGGTVRPKGSELFIAGGGHLDYAGNEIFSISLGAATPVWRRLIDPSPVTPQNTPYYPDGRPSSRHTYRNIAYSSTLDKLIFFGGAPWGSKPTYNNLVDAFDLQRNEYAPKGSISPAPRSIGGPSGTAMAANGDFYIHHYSDGHLYKWQQSTNSWFDLGKKGNMQYETPYALDTKRNRLFRVRWGSQPARIYDLNDNGAFSNVEVGGPAAESIDTGASMVYDPVVDVYWLWKRNDANLYRIDAETFEASVQPVTGTLPKVEYRDARHRVYGRFNYMPELRGLVFMLDHTTDVMFIRTAP